MENTNKRAYRFCVYFLTVDENKISQVFYTRKLGTDPSVIINMIIAKGFRVTNPDGSVVAIPPHRVSMVIYEELDAPEGVRYERY